MYKYMYIKYKYMYGIDICVFSVAAATALRIDFYLIRAIDLLLLSQQFARMNYDKSFALAKWSTDT